MPVTTEFPLAVTQEGTAQNAVPANDNSLRLEALGGHALGFAAAAPSSPANHDQWVVSTTWGGHASGNVVIYLDGAWLEFAAFDGMTKTIAGVRSIKIAGAWQSILTWVDVPGTVTSPGSSGQVAYDLSTLFFYVCTAANTWKRALLDGTIVPPPPPPTYPTPALLLDYEGATVADRGPNHLAVTVSGSAAIDTAHLRFGASALHVNGGHLSVTDASLVIGTRDFTVDMWVYVTDLSAEKFFLDTRDNGNDDNGFAFYFSAGGYLAFYEGSAYLGADSMGQSGTTLTANQWQHIEVGRSSGTVHLFVDGVLVASSATNAYPNNFHSQTVIVHAAQYFPAGVSPMPGWADEVRMVIGLCVDTSGFSVPSRPYTTY